MVNQQMKNNQDSNLIEGSDSFFISDELSGLLEYNLNQYKIQEEEEQQKINFDYTLNIHGMKNNLIQVPIKFLEFNAGNLFDNKKSTKSEKYYKAKILYNKDIKITDLLFIKKMEIKIIDNNEEFIINFLDYSFDFENKIITVKEFNVDT